MGIRSPCSRQNSQNQRTSFLADTGKKTFICYFVLSCSYRKSFFTANALTLPVRCPFFKRAIKILLACFTCGGWSTKLPVTTKVYRKTKDTFLLKAKREVICIWTPFIKQVRRKAVMTYKIQNQVARNFFSSSFLLACFTCSGNCIWNSVCNKCFSLYSVAIYKYVFICFCSLFGQKAYTVHWCDEDAHLVSIRLPESIVL